MILKMVLTRKGVKIFLEKFKAVKIHPISKGVETPTKESTTGTFEGCGLCDIIRGLSVEMSMRKHSFFNF